MDMNLIPQGNLQAALYKRFFQNRPWDDLQWSQNPLAEEEDP